MTRILVINPNSNVSVTGEISRALDGIRTSSGAEIVCSTLAKGPFGIESDADIQTVIPLVVSEISGNKDFDVYVIACYSDPGLAESRTIAKKPVLGIQESAVTLSASCGRSFGVLALGRESIQRHIAYVRNLGFQQFHAGERPLNVSVDEAANDPATLDKIIAVGRELIDEDKAQSIVFGCAGLAAHQSAAQQALGVPVIEPTEAAVTLALQAAG
jgi:Asp/Glu/hydantoin racemase